MSEPPAIPRLVGANPPAYEPNAKPPNSPVLFHHQSRQQPPVSRQPTQSLSLPAPGKPSPGHRCPNSLRPWPRSGLGLPAPAPSQGPDQHRSWTWSRCWPSQWPSLDSEQGHDLSRVMALSWTRYKESLLGWTRPGMAWVGGVGADRDRG